MTPPGFAKDCVDTEALYALIREKDPMCILSSEDQQDKKKENVWEMGDILELSELVRKMLDDDRMVLHLVTFGDGPWGFTSVPVLVLAKTNDEACERAEEWYDEMYPREAEEEEDDEAEEGDGHGTSVEELVVPVLEEKDEARPKAP